MLAVQGFDESSGEPTNPVPMKNWPYHRLLLEEGFTHRHARRSVAPFLSIEYWPAVPHSTQAEDAVLA